MSMMSDVIAIRVALSGMDEVMAGLRSFTSGLKGTQSELAGVKRALKEVAIEVAIMAASVKEAAIDESMKVQLEALTHSMSIADDQMHTIRQTSDRGIFDKQELFDAVKILDESHVSLKENLKVIEELGARKGGHVLQAAQVVAELAGGGKARLQGFLKGAGITAEQLREQGLTVSDHLQISNSPAQILDALKAITTADSLLGKMGSTAMASFKGLVAAARDFARSLGDHGVLQIVGFLAETLRRTLMVVTALNDGTFGLVGNLLALAAGAKAVMAVRTAFVAVTEAVNTAKVAMLGLKAAEQGVAAAGAAAAASSAGTAVAAGGAGVATEVATGGGLLAALLAPEILIPLLIAAGIGAAVWGISSAMDANNSETPADRPIRRSDTENISSNMNGRKWA